MAYGRVEHATRAELLKAGVGLSGSALAAMAVRLAWLLDQPETSAAVAPRVAAELRQALGAALAAGVSTGDSLDELKGRRVGRRGQAAEGS